MLPAIPHRTADSRRVAPTPMIDAVVIFVVDTGTANTVAAVTMTLDATACAAKPPEGVSWLIRRPMVRMMQKPPGVSAGADRRCGGQDDPERAVETVDLARGVQREG